MKNMENEISALKAQGTMTYLDEATMRSCEPYDYTRKDGSVLEMFLLPLNERDMEELTLSDAARLRFKYACQKAQSLGGWWVKERKGFAVRTLWSAVAVSKKLC